MVDSAYMFIFLLIALSHPVCASQCSKSFGVILIGANYVAFLVTVDIEMLTEQCGYCGTRLMVSGNVISSRRFWLEMCCIHMILDSSFHPTFPWIVFL